MSTKLAPQWQASEARHRFSEVMDAAAAGAPQLVRRRDGREVVVVSREYFERTKPNWKDALLHFRFEHDDGSFDEAMKDARRVVGEVFMPRESIVENLLRHDDPGHRRRKRAAAKR